MLNYLWAGMMAVGILWGAFHGNLAAVTDGALESTKEAVTLCLTMLGVMSFWCGILKIGEKAGLIEAMTEKMKPVIRFLFPNLPPDHPAASFISTNMIANMLGLGWAATPAGLKAMEELEKLEDERRERGGTAEKVQPWENGRFAGKGLSGKGAPRRFGTAVDKGTASNEMCTFLIINISSLQLIPINMIAYRSQYGSLNPSAVTGPALAATAVSTGAAIIFCKFMDRKGKA